MNGAPTIIMFDFQKLEVYKKAQLFYAECKGISKNKLIERYVRDQLSRASYSIVLNIAEGSGRKSPADRKNFFTISRASVFECVAILDMLNLENIVNTESYRNQLEKASEISKMLYAMIRNLSNWIG